MTDMCFRTATEMSTMLETREISATELLDAHRNQIDAHNQAINAIVTPTPELAQSQAVASDKRLMRGERISPLDGLPLTAKDKFNMAGVRTTYGSPAFADHVPEVDDLIVERERAAGVVFLGKSNTPEFSFGGQTHNPVFGLTHNPYAENISVSGSSGGSAAALASGMATLANGSDIAGALRAPAAWCNVVGFRPTPGRIPVNRTSNTWEDFSVHGPMARSAADIALYMSVIAGPSDVSPVSWPTTVGEFTGTLERDWQDVRIAWSLDMSTDKHGLQRDPAMAETIEGVRPVFAALGAHINDACPAIRYSTDVLNGYKCLAALSRLDGLIDAQPELFKPGLHYLVEKARAFTADDVMILDKRRTEIWRRMTAFFKDFDYLVWPTTPSNPILAGDDDSAIDWGMLDPQPLLGLPAISVPCGFSDEGLPVGIQITGKRGDDMGVIQLAYAFERETGFWQRRPPGM